MKKRRITVISAAYPAPSEPTRAIFLQNFLEVIAGESFEITVVAPRIHRSDPLHEEDDRIVVERFRYPSGGKRLKELRGLSTTMLGAYVASATWTLERVVRRTASSLIYAHWALPAGFVAALVAARAGLPLVIHAHGSDIHHYAFKSPALHRASRWALGRAAAVVATSGDIAGRLESGLGVPSERLSVVPMGCDSRLFSRGDHDFERRRLELEDSALNVLFVGDLDPGKGILRLARSLLGNGNVLPQLRLHVAGDGVLRPELEALAAVSGNHLRLHGRLPQAEIASWCRAADLLVLPSRAEGCPLVIMEAQSSGLPVLATPVGGIPDLVRDGKSGWLAEIEEFPERIAALVRRPEILRKARNYLADSAEDHSAERHGLEAVAILNRVMKGRTLVELAG